MGKVSTPLERKSALIGKTVSHYRITGKLGEGGMGAVYLAEDLKLQRSVALKCLRADATTDLGARERLLREARLASRLSHPSIATIYEVGEDKDIPFIAMEFVNGESLYHLLLRGVVPATDLAGIARPIAEGLHEAHDSGVLHRDMKPGNVMIDERKHVKILDFGLATLASLERSPGESLDAFVTRSVSQWSTGGTVPYMAPEQLLGETVDARVDIFSFGVLLYECIAGRLPFPGKTAVDVMHRILNVPPVELREVVPDVSPQWERVIERCMAKKPEQRFASMSEVLDALPSGSARRSRAEKSVAVLYFENLSDANDDAYFRDGMTEDTITELSKVRQLRVFPRSAVLAYRDKPVTAPQIGQELDALYVLEGSLRRAGNRLRITARLVETRTGHSIWAERFDRQMEDVFAIQEEIAQSIARALRVVLTTEEKEAIVRTAPVDVRAYDYYLRGRQSFYQWRRQGLELATRMYRQAIEIDPGYARAYAGIADCHSLLYAYWDPSAENLEQADEASRQALELDSGLAESHSARGLVLSLRKNYDDARKEFEAAIRLNSKLFEAFYFYARVCLARGNLVEAARLFELASGLRPEDFQASSHLGGVYAGLGRESESADTYRRTLRVIEEHLKLNPGDGRALYLGATALARLGEADRATEWADKAVALDPEEPVTLYNVACVYSIQGETAKAVECLEEAVRLGFAHKEWILSDSDLHPLRDIPRFQALVERM